MLAEASGIKVVGEASSGEEAVRKARELMPSVVLMDIKMPGIGGLGATKRLLRVNPDIKILIVTVCDDDLFPSRLLQAGANGYLTKGASMAEMIQAIRAVSVGQRYISPDIAKQLAFRHLDHRSEQPFETLSERELQVMLMITKGIKVQEISNDLCLSAKTINTYRYRIFDKLAIKNDVELTHMALKHGILDDLVKSQPSDD